MRDLANHLNVLPAIAPAAAVTNTNPIVGPWIDRAGYESLMFAIQAGALFAGSAFAVTVDVADLLDKSDAITAPASKLTGTFAQAAFAAADTGKTRKIGYVGTRRYVRLTVTPTVNGGASYVSALAILSDARFSPTPNPPA